MSGFWDNNKDSIKSGLVSAGKYSYQGTKYVAKTGYSASKKHFNESKKKRDAKDKKKKKKKHDKDSDSEYETDSDYESGEPSRSLETLQNPSAFPPPPLKAGQMQYGSGGNIVTGDGSSPAVSMPNQQGYQQPMQQGYQQPIQQGYQPQMQQGYQQPMQREAMQLPPQQQGYQQGYQPPMQQPPMQQPPMQQQPMQQQPMQQQPMQQQPMQQQGYQQGYQQPMQQQPMQQRPMQQPQQMLPVPGQQPPLAQRQAMQLPGEPQVQPYGQQTEQQPQQQMVPGQLPPRQVPSLPTGNRPAMSLPNTGQNTPQSGYMTPASNSVSMTNIQEQNHEDSEPKDFTPGPHYEVKPFNQAAYEENKDKKMIEIKQSDISTFAPPPSHKDRGANMRPRRTLNGSNSTGSLQTSNRNIASMKNSVETTTQNRSTPTIPDNKSETSNSETGSIEVESQETKSDEPPKAAVLGAYQEPTTTFAPPPKPRGIPQPVRNSPAVARSGPKIVSPASTTSLPARPSLPTRSTGSSIEPTQPAAEIASQTSETSSIATSAKEPEEHKAPILGTYVEKPVAFAPPPKPFRDVETNQHKQVGSSSVPVASSSQTSISSGPPPPARTSLPSRGDSTTSVGSDSKPKPHVVSPPNSGNMRDVSSFLPPPKPFRHTESTQEKTPSREVDENKPLVTKKKAPPPVKPKKPNMLNNSSFSKVYSTPSDSPTPLTKRSTAPTLGKKNPPPVVKPKPKNLSRTNTSPINDIANELSSVHLRHTRQGPPVPTSRHHSEPSIPDATGTTKTNTENDVNPFSIYKKDAVPLDEDRIHNRR